MRVKSKQPAALDFPVLGFRKAARLLALGLLATGVIAAWRWRTVLDPLAISAVIDRYQLAPLGFLAVHIGASLLFVPRTLLAVVAGLLFGVAWGIFWAEIGSVAGAAGQSWPQRPVTMVVPFAAGSSSDTVGRVLAIGLSEALGQQVIIETIGGAGGMTGTARVAKAPPDGYQCVFASVDSMAIVPAMYKKPLYNSVTDFTAAGLVVEQPIVLITRKDLPVNTLQEFVAYAKANHGKMQFGSSGVGSGSHFSCAKLNAALGIDPQCAKAPGRRRCRKQLLRTNRVCRGHAGRAALPRWSTWQDAETRRGADGAGQFPNIRRDRSAVAGHHRSAWQAGDRQRQTPVPSGARRAGHVPLAGGRADGPVPRVLRGRSVRGLRGGA